MPKLIHNTHGNQILFSRQKFKFGIFRTQIGWFTAENRYLYYLPMFSLPKLPVEKNFIKQSCWVMSGLPPARKIFWFIDFGFNTIVWGSRQIANASRKTRYRSPLGLTKNPLFYFELPHEGPLFPNFYDPTWLGRLHCALKLETIVIQLNCKA